MTRAVRIIAIAIGIEFRIGQIACGHTIAACPHLAFVAKRQGPQIIIKDINRIVWGGLTDREISLVRAMLNGRIDNRGFSRATGIIKSTKRCPSIRQRSRARLARHSYGFHMSTLAGVQCG